MGVGGGSYQDSSIADVMAGHQGLMRQTAAVIKHGMSQSWVTFDWNSENFAGPSGKFIPEGDWSMCGTTPCMIFTNASAPFQTIEFVQKRTQLITSPEIQSQEVSVR